MSGAGKSLGPCLRRGDESLLLMPAYARSDRQRSDQRKLRLSLRRQAGKLSCISCMLAIHGHWSQRLCRIDAHFESLAGLPGNQGSAILLA